MSPQQAVKSIPQTHRRFETLEERLPLTAQAWGEFEELFQFSNSNKIINAESVQELVPPEQQIDYIRQQYSLMGSGQTVAIIDSGIAWDHYALGGGFGKEFRVVGGWDFAENDSDPFDDGPAGFHGTHVAGIVASDDSNHEGVAPGVDLVGLRVFDDLGAGKLEWVEQALQWVHRHRNDFEYPITTVNLSLGLHWNSNSVPEWSMLEDEFAQLKKDGIFIAVAAGNSFQEFRTDGVSYPAASKWVVPAASHGSDGLLSDFSQRDNRTIAAPGENISSTIPAHLFGQTGQSNKFLTTSGTSMSAPFLAGSSVLLREALHLAGKSIVDQNSIYRHFRETADQVYDEVTRSWYSRLNLKAAIDAALEDGHGNRPSHATGLSKVSKLSRFEGVLAKSEDTDFFRFQADQSGKLQFRVDTTHTLDLQFHVIGQTVNQEENQYSLMVESGQEYVIRLNSRAGQGCYKIKTVFDSAEPIDLGMIRSAHFTNLSMDGKSDYRFTAARNALISIEALFSATNGNIEFEVYAENNQKIAIGTAESKGIRTDFMGQRSASYTIRLIGHHPEFDLKLTNLVRVTDDLIVAGGTGLADQYSYQSLPGFHQISVKGTTYLFSKTEFRQIKIQGGAGHDKLVVTGSEDPETLTGGNGRITIEGTDTKMLVRNIELIRVHGNGGNDLAFLSDSPGTDFFRGTATKSELKSRNFHLSIKNFKSVKVFSEFGGRDRAILTGTSLRDFLHIHNEGTSFTGSGFHNEVIGFGQVQVNSNGGRDSFSVKSSQSHEVFRFNPRWEEYQNITWRNPFTGFSSIEIHSGHATDTALSGLDHHKPVLRSSVQVGGKTRGSDISMMNDSNSGKRIELIPHDSEVMSAVASAFRQMGGR